MDIYFSSPSHNSVPPSSIKRRAQELDGFTPQQSQIYAVGQQIFPDEAEMEWYPIGDLPSTLTSENKSHKKSKKVASIGEKILSPLSHSSSNDTFHSYPIEPVISPMSTVSPVHDTFEGTEEGTEEGAVENSNEDSPSIDELEDEQNVSGNTFPHKDEGENKSTNGRGKADLFEITLSALSEVIQNNAAAKAKKGSILVSPGSSQPPQPTFSHTEGKLHVRHQTTASASKASDNEKKGSSNEPQCTVIIKKVLSPTGSSSAAVNGQIPGTFSGYGKIIDPNGQGEYEGWIKDNEPDGQGTLRSSLGSKLSPVGATFVGTFSKGLFHGVVTCIDSTHIYTSLFERGLPHKVGAVFFMKGPIKGQTFIGECLEGTPHGEGRLQVAANLTLYGSFVDGLCQGPAIMEQLGGPVMKGNCKDGLFDGLVEISFPDGSKSMRLFERGVMQLAVGTPTPIIDLTNS